MPTTRTKLLNATKALCADFAAQKDVDVLLSHFSTTHQLTALEHGLSSLAPFLGRRFVGHDGIKEYFETISKHLTYTDMSFSEWVIDAEARKVSVKGEAKSTWLSTQESWEETFVYVLDFDEEEKVTDYQVWADTGAAYLARKGKLSQLDEEMDKH
ncbi:hypothetical protein BJ138DRAFT_1066864 [Hygrophoropsis aurantiaca]|uniref:Uncharacterized protein n=1 Tax=Hygrophoropsis aurantiaca TaxID=72124 RepID=A0ACB8A839_9AGAM|nr:hypothetical protein BJ138DRAFT_1066864 [Hygrophoropsis aurantiaca]